MGKDKPQELELWVEPSETVREVKEKLQKLMGVEVKRQRMIFNGRQLDNSALLGHQGVQNDDEVLHLVLLEYRDRGTKKK